MTLYNKWFEEQIDKDLYFNKFTSLSELQRTALDNLKCDAINFKDYKLIINLITQKIQNITMKEK